MRRRGMSLIKLLSSSSSLSLPAILAERARVSPTVEAKPYLNAREGGISLVVRKVESYIRSRPDLRHRKVAAERDPVLTCCRKSARI